MLFLAHFLRPPSLCQGHPILYPPPSMFIHTQSRFSSKRLSLLSQYTRKPSSYFFCRLVATLPLSTHGMKPADAPHLSSFTPQFFFSGASPLGSESRRSSSCFCRSFRARVATHSSSSSFCAPSRPSGPGGPTW